MARKPTDKQRRSATAAIAGPGHPPSLQVGALCWRRTKGGAIRVLLATSRDTGRWVIPKGWPMRKRTEPEAAAREAFEEAGVQGEVEGRSIGLFTYEKGLGRGRSLTCVVKVFPLRVRELRQVYPETGQRRVKWFAAEKAAGRVQEPELATLIRAFAAALDAPEPEPPAEPDKPPAPEPDQAAPR